MSSVLLGQRIKTAVMTALATALADDNEIQVSYAPTRDMARKAVLGGSVEATERISAGRNSDGYTTRDVNGTFEVMVRVTLPGATQEDTETAAGEIGAELENFLALNTPVLDGGDLNASVEGWNLNSWFDDEAAITLLTYRLAFQATIP